MTRHITKCGTLERHILSLIQCTLVSAWSLEHTSAKILLYEWQDLGFATFPCLDADKEP
jgi:hypothetical protein